MTKKLIRLKINNKSYGILKGVTIYLTTDLKQRLEKIKKKDGTDLFKNLQQRGFSGGKHLIELLIRKYGKQFKLVLSDKNSIKNNTVTINYEYFNHIARRQFFSVYREYGLKAALDFLQQEFSSEFSKEIVNELRPQKGTRKVFKDLSEEIENLPQKDQEGVPKQIAKVIQKLIKEQPHQYIFSLLSAIDESLRGSNERMRVSFKEIMLKISKEPTKAMQELSDLMDNLNLLQVTSLLNILRNRIETISTFDEMIHNDKTYELKSDKSIHRVLEKSMWIIDDKYWIVQSNKSLREFIGSEFARIDKKYEKKRPDFACVTFNTKLIIIEIKRPSVELKKKELDQVEDYQLIIKKYKGEEYSSIEIFLIGKKISGEARDRANLRKGIILMTYQDLLEKCRQRYEEYLKIIER